jgi:hypothetical protein
MYFALCKEQQNSQKQENFCDFGVAEAPPGFQAGCDRRYGMQLEIKNREISCSSVV